MDAFLQETVDLIRRHAKLVIAEDFEILVQRTRLRERRFENGLDAGEKNAEGWYAALRLVHRQRPGMAVTTRFSRAALNSLVENAFQAASEATGDPWFRFPIWKAAAPAPALESAPEPEMVPYDSLFSSISDPPRLFTECYRVRRVNSLLHRKGERHALTHSTEQHEGEFSALRPSGESLVCLREKRGFSRPLAERKEWVARLSRLSARLTEGKPARPLSRASFVFAPAAAARLVAWVAPWFLADRVREGQSPVRLDSEMALFSPLVSLVDDGRYPGGIRSAPFDREGTPTGETCLVERGRLRSLLYDTYLATRENRRSTGNWLQDHNRGSDAAIRASTFYLKPWDQAPEELLQEMGRGFLVEHVDSLEGAGGPTKIRLRASGWWVEQGAPVGAITGLEVRCDLVDLFRHAVGIGKDLSFFGCYGAPSIYFEKMPLGR